MKGVHFINSLCISIRNWHLRCTRCCWFKICRHNWVKLPWWPLFSFGIDFFRTTDCRKKFEEYIIQQASKKNGKALTDELYDQIVGILKETNPPFSSLMRRIRRNGFRLMDYPKFSLKDVLCTPIKDKVSLLIF